VEPLKTPLTMAYIKTKGSQSTLIGDILHSFSVALKTDYRFVYESVVPIEIPFVFKFKPPDKV